MAILTIVNGQGRVKLYIRVINWETYQNEAVTHRGGRPKKDGSPARPSSPEFFAVFVNLWRKRQYKRLQDRDKLALFTIWQLTALQGNGNVPADAEYIRDEGAISGDVHLGELYDAGFVEFINDAGELVETLPTHAWGQPLARVEAAERLTSPLVPSPQAMERLVRDVEILGGRETAENRMVEPNELVMETNRNQSETSEKPAPEVSNQIREEESRKRGEENIYGQSSVVDVGGNDLQIIVQDLPDDVRAEMLRLANAIPRGQQSIGRMVNLARAGATARMFADARQAYQVTDTRKPNPGAWVCEVIEENMRKGAA